ncbi:hypothetical protein V8E54_005403 [Elaphomyces granulatus]
MLNAAMDQHNNEMESMSSTPFLRASSPSPSVSPTPAISSCPSPGRSFSTVSSLSNFSVNSGDGRSCSRRRGYIRPHGVEFADSARNRESVMCLGSIAHLQYYFARTGLLDGKGGQLARPQRKKSQNEIPKLLLTQDTDDTHFGDDLVESPIDELSDLVDEFDDDEEVMLPPTVSTYSIKTHYIPPPPDLKALRKDLLDALEKASQGVHECEVDPGPGKNMKSTSTASPEETPGTEEDGLETPAVNLHAWYEIQGMHILDLVTLAIRAARIYYTSHERPDRLAAIKEEKKIRGELLGVLDVLKRWASRSFVGGLRNDERSAILQWMSGVRTMLDKEQEVEATEAEERASWRWVDGDWTGKERERQREEAFLQTLMAGIDSPLPTWTSPNSGPLPTAMLERLRDGRDLIRLHNQAVKKSKRPFGGIKTFHENVAKPYRCAENLRYWIKAAEIRWEIKLEIDVMGVVYGHSDSAWVQFDTALLAWCQGVREELMRDWYGPNSMLPMASSEV